MIESQPEIIVKREDLDNLINEACDINLGQKRQIAQTIIYDKFVGYIYKTAIQVCSNFEDSEHIAADITQQTFIKAFEKLATFSFKGEKEHVIQERLMKAWLGKIANTFFLKEYSRRKNSNIVLEDEFERELYENLFYDDTDENEEEIPNEYKIKLGEALTLLTEEQRFILFAYAREGCIGAKIHLSANTLKHLSDTFNTTSENIRQIKKRSLDKIKNHCLSK